MLMYVDVHRNQSGRKSVRGAVGGLDVVYLQLYK